MTKMTKNKKLIYYAGYKFAYDNYETDIALDLMHSNIADELGVFEEDLDDLDDWEPYEQAYENGMKDGYEAVVNGEN